MTPGKLAQLTTGSAAAAIHGCIQKYPCFYIYHHNRSTALFWDHPGEPVPQENFWTL